jgi:hypothetical protein
MRVLRGGREVLRGLPLGHVNGRRRKSRESAGRKRAERKKGERKKGNGTAPLSSPARTGAGDQANRKKERELVVFRVSAYVALKRRSATTVKGD